MWRQIQQWFTPKQADLTTPTGVDLSEACFWQADMHSHLLPGIDDGVTSDEEALTCLRQLVDWGIRHVVTTPHISRDLFPHNTSAALRSALGDLQRMVVDYNLPLQVEVAAEYMLDDFFPALLRENDLLTFGPQRYVLVETGFVAVPRYLEDVLFQMRTAGYAPVLAHPERYRFYWNDEPALARLREQGCLFQLNWMSMTGQYGPNVFRQAQRLLTNEWVDFVGSDLHRPVQMDRMAKLFNSPEYELLKKQPLRNASLVSTELST